MISRPDLRNLLTVVFVTSVAFMAVAFLLALISLEYDLFLFAQILIYPALISASIIFFKATALINNDRSFIWRVFIVALLVRIVAVIILYHLLIQFQGHPYLEGYKDEYTYHTISTYFAYNHWAPLKEIRYLGLSENYGLYPYLVGLFYRLFGIHTLVARFLNAFFGAVCVIPFYLFVRNLNIGRQTAKLATILYVFSANFIIFNSIQLKDTLAMLLCFILLHLGSSVMREKKLTRILLITTAYFLINFLFIYVRGQFFFLFTFFYLIFIYSSFSEKASFVFSRTAIVMLVGIGIFLVKQSAIDDISSRMGQLSIDYVQPQFLRYQKWQLSTLIDGPLIPIGTAALGFFLPFPTLVRLPNLDLYYSSHVFKMPALFEIYFTSIISLFVIFLGKKKNFPHQFKVVVLLAFIFYVSVLVMGYLASERHKLFLTSLFLIIMAYGINERAINFRKLIFICIIGAVFVFAYNLMRMLSRGVI